MSLYHATETLLVPLIVLGCATSAASRYMPRTRERIKSALAARLGGMSANGWRARVVVRLAPTAAAGCASGCDSGGCNTCASNTTPVTGMRTEQPIRLVRKL